MIDPSCLHDRVVRLEVPGHDDHWICTQCNAQFVPKKAVDYKIASLVASVYKLTEEVGSLRHDQTERMRREEGIQE